MRYKFTCDDCGKYLGTYIKGKGGIEEKAVVEFRKSTIPIWDGVYIVGKKEINIGYPDITCFSYIDAWAPNFSLE